MKKPVKSLSTARVGNSSAMVQYSIANLGCEIQVVRHHNNGAAEMLLNGGDKIQVVKPGDLRPTNEYFSVMELDEMLALTEALMGYFGLDQPNPQPASTKHADDLKHLSLEILKKVPNAKA